MMDDSFALLPPHWNPSSPCLSTLELREIITGYETLDTTFQAVIPYLLPSIIYHASWVKENYPAHHPIFNTRFWTDNYHIKYRQSILTGNFFNEVIKMKATGVSGLMRKMYLLEQILIRLVNPQNKIKEN